MVVSSAFRRALVALAMCSAAIAVSTSSASARSYHHGKGRYAHARHVVHHARRAVHHRAHHAVAHASRRARSIEKLRGSRLPNVQARGTPAEGTATSGGFGGSDLVSEARRYLGGNPTSRASLWRARFMNMVLDDTRRHGTGSDLS